MDKFKIMAAVIALFGFYNVNNGSTLGWLILAAGIYMLVTSDYKFVKVREKVADMLSTKEKDVEPDSDVPHFDYLHQTRQDQDTKQP